MGIGHSVQCKPVLSRQLKQDLYYQGERVAVYAIACDELGSIDPDRGGYISNSDK
jgi:hypothetical protein